MRPRAVSWLYCSPPDLQFNLEECTYSKQYLTRHLVEPIVREALRSHGAYGALHCIYEYDRNMGLPKKPKTGMVKRGSHNYMLVITHGHADALTANIKTGLQV